MHHVQRHHQDSLRPAVTSLHGRRQEARSALSSGSWSFYSNPVAPWTMTHGKRCITRAKRTCTHPPVPTHPAARTASSDTCVTPCDKRPLLFVFYPIHTEMAPQPPYLRSGGEAGRRPARQPSGSSAKVTAAAKPPGGRASRAGVLLLPGTAGTAGLSKRKAGKAGGATGVGFRRHLYS